MAVTWVKPTGKHIVGRAGEGYLEVCASPLGELPVVHVSGDREEMGIQYGALVANRIRRNVDRSLALFAGLGLPEELVFRLLDNAWKRLEPHVPERYLREMAAISRGARAAGFPVAVEDLQRVTTVTNLDMYKREERLAEFLGEDALPYLEQMKGQRAMSCTMLAVWGSRTVDGKMFAHRNLDWISQTGMHEDRLITVYRPEDGCAFATMGYAGITGALAGMNENGISFSEVGAFSVREELDGTPWTLMARQVLEDAGCLEDAVAIVENAKHTIGYNYLVADGAPAHFGAPSFRPRAAAFETNFACCETFYENDDKEHAAAWIASNGRSVPYGLPLCEAVVRADTAFGKRSRALQATDNGPGEPANDGSPFKEFLGNTYLECHRPMHDMIRAYETGGEYVYPLRGRKVIEACAPRKIGREEALTIAATVAHNTEKLSMSDWNVMSVVYAPTDLEFWVSYESRDAEGTWKNAPDSGYWHFSLKDLMA